MIKTMQQSAKDTILAVAELMVTAAYTAPKGSGRDTIVAAVVTGEDKDRLRDATLEVGQEAQEEFIIRDFCRHKYSAAFLDRVNGIRRADINKP